MAYGSTPKKKKLDKEFGRSAGLSAIEKAKQDIKAKKKTTKGKKILAKMAPKKESAPKKEGWYPGKYIGKALKKFQKKGRAVQAKSRLKKDLGLKVTSKQAEKYGKVRKGAKGAEMTKGGAYVKYEKKSKAAGSFRSAFKSNCAGKGAGDTFTWDGRTYSCKKK